MLLAPQHRAAALASLCLVPYSMPTTQRAAPKSRSRHFLKKQPPPARWLELASAPFFSGSRARIGPTAVRARAGWLSLRRGARPPVHCGTSISPMSAVGRKQTLRIHLARSLGTVDTVTWHGPLWRGSLARSLGMVPWGCPLCPRKRASSDAASMSAECQERINAVQQTGFIRSSRRRGRVAWVARRGRVPWRSSRPRARNSVLCEIGPALAAASKCGATELPRRCCDRREIMNRIARRGASRHASLRSSTK